MSYEWRKVRCYPKTDYKITKDKLEDSISLSKVESKELDCTMMNYPNSNNHPAKLRDADTTFMEFVVIEVLGMVPEAKKNIVG